MRYRVDMTVISQSRKEEYAYFEQLSAAYPHIRVRRVLSYRVLDALMRANENPDFFSGLPMQTSQAVLKEAVTVFKAWLSAVKDYKEECSGH